MIHRTRELFSVWLALFLARLTPARLHTRLCRWIYPYNAARNRGFDWVIDYKPLQGMEPMKILVNTTEFVGWNILFLKHYEQDTNLVLQRWIREGMTVVEAGAHIGSETLLLAQMAGKAGKVFAFEPNPVVKKRLDLNILLNRFEDRIASSGTALGDKNGAMSFYVMEENIPNQGLSSKYRFDKVATSIEVPQQTLDDWSVENRIERLDFLKMDVQGAEIDILKGAATCISRFRPLIFTEAADSTQSDSSQSLGDLYESLASMDYRICFIRPDGSLTQIDKSSLKNGNWLAIPTEYNDHARV